MISRAHRFHGYNSLNHVYRNGVSSRGPLFAIKATSNPRRKSYRAAVVVSRKVSKSAVARNRIRRRLYEALRELEPQITTSFDIVVTVFQDSLLETPSEKLKSQLVDQLRELSIIKSV
jgi:ribonuclease P protein component